MKKITDPTVAIGTLKKERQTIIRQIIRLERDRLNKASRFFENVPKPEPGTVEATSKGEGLPSTSGIYFVWEGPLLCYVGKSTNIKSRAKLYHDRIFPGDTISWIELPEWELYFAELYYIAVMRPIRNYNADAALTAGLFRKALSRKNLDSKTM